MFIKFGSEENIKDLLDNGCIYMNSKESFRGIEDKELRGDSYEGVIEIRNLPAGIFSIPGINFSGRYQNIHLPKFYQEVWGNLYCLTSISNQTIPNPFEYKIDERLAGFGTHCLLIKDVEKFVRLITCKMDLLNYKYTYDFVKYYDKKMFNGRVSVFDKPLEFEYQKEFRFYIERVGVKPIIFNIGSLKEIAEIFTTETIMTLKIEPDKNPIFELPIQL
jgi:hypothetical protein